MFALSNLVFVGSALQLLGILSYIKETIWGNTKPNRVTWLMWAIAPLIATAAALVEGVGWAVLPVFMAGFGPALVFFASFINPNAYWKLERFDYLCGLCSVLALILWFVTNEPIIAIIFAIASDGFAAIPTLIKAWHFPETETVHPYSTTLLSVILGGFAIEVWEFSSYGFSLYLAIVNILLIFAIYHRKIWPNIN